MIYIYIKMNKKTFEYGITKSARPCVWSGACRIRQELEKRKTREEKKKAREQTQEWRTKQETRTSQRRRKGYTARPMTRHRPAPTTIYPQPFRCAKQGVQPQAVECGRKHFNGRSGQVGEAMVQPCWSSEYLLRQVTVRSDIQSWARARPRSAHTAPQSLKKIFKL